jgi:hypothetical protein
VASLGLKERLSKHFENVARKLWKFLQKEHAVMRHADFAGPWNGSASNEASVGDGVMG